MASAYVHAGGMVTAVGSSLPATCAAVRAGLTRFRETRFLDEAGEWIRAAEVDLEELGSGRARMREALFLALEECLAAAVVPAGAEPALVLCLAEDARPGRLELDATLLGELSARLSVRFDARSRVLARGRAGGVEALVVALELLEGGAPAVIIAGCDSLLTPLSLSELERRRRVLTTTFPDGFLPGEAAAAVVVTRGPLPGQPSLRLMGLGFAREGAGVESGEPLRGLGLAAAMKAALSTARLGMQDIDYRITALNGESYFFREASLAQMRLLRVRREQPADLWHPADAVGETGAASAVVAMNVAAVAAAKGYAPGPVAMLHVSNDDEVRAAAILGAVARGRA